MTSPLDEASTPLTLDDLVKAVELREIITYKVAGERVVNEIEDLADSAQKLDGMCRADAALVETRFQMTFEGPGVTYFADHGLVFRFEAANTRPLPKQVLGEFMSTVGAMAAFPYLRESITGLAARMGMPVPVIGLLRRGDLSFDLGDDAEPSAALVPEQTTATDPS